MINMNLSQKKKEKKKWRIGGREFGTVGRLDKEGTDTDDKLNRAVCCIAFSLWSSRELCKVVKSPWHVMGC